MVASVRRPISDLDQIALSVRVWSIRPIGQDQGSSIDQLLPTHFPTGLWGLQLISTCLLRFVMTVSLEMKGRPPTGSAAHDKSF